MHHTLCTSCTAFILVSHSLHIGIDHVEQGREEPSEPSSVEDTDPEQAQGKPKCILPHPLIFIYFFSYFVILERALGHTSWIEALVVQGHLPIYP
jgi:hypothetical protein